MGLAPLSHCAHTAGMTKHIAVLGAGFGGMEFCTLLAESVPGEARITLIDSADSFVFGYSKLDVMFGRATPDAVRLPYAEFVKPGVDFVHDRVVAIDPARRTVSTTSTTFDADVLVVALGADYDLAATPGLTPDDEFYAVAGAARMRDRIAQFSAGSAVIGVCGAPFKCPPARAERVRAAPPRRPRPAGRPRRLPDHAGDALQDAGTALARHLGRSPRGVRRARHPLPA